MGQTIFGSFERDITKACDAEFYWKQNKKLNTVTLIELFARTTSGLLSSARYTWESHRDVIDYWYGAARLAKHVSRVTCESISFRVEEFDNGRINIFAFDVLYAPCAGVVRVRISTKSSIVWKPSWITSSRWHSRVLRRSYFITSIFPSLPPPPSPSSLADQFSALLTV